jgi:putative DNA primase/helicase
MSTNNPRTKQAGRVRVAPEQLNGHAEAHGNGKAEADASTLGIQDITAHKVKARETVYLWDRRLAIGKATLLVGETGAGKSTLATLIAAYLTRGEALPGGPAVEACNVAIWTAEEGVADDWLSRLKRAQANLRRVHFPGVDDAGVLRQRLQLPAEGPAMRDYLIKRKIRLAIFDPIGSCLEPGLDENAGTTARPVMQALIDAARDAACSALPIKHPRKGVAGGALDRISGSKEWVNVPRFVLLVGEDPNDKDVRVMASLKPRPPGTPASLTGKIDVAKNVARWTWKGETPLAADEVMTGAGDALGRSQLDEAKEIIRELVNGREVLAKNVLQAGEDSGVSNNTMKEAKRQLGVTSHPVGPNEDRKWYWRAPKGGCPK